MGGVKRGGLAQRERARVGLDLKVKTRVNVSKLSPPLSKHWHNACCSLDKRSATDEPSEAHQRHTNGAEDAALSEMKARLSRLAGGTAVAGGRAAATTPSSPAAATPLAKPQLADPACQSAKRSFLIFYE